LYRYHLGRLDWVDELVAKHGIRRAQDAHAKGQPAIIQDIEGCDFLEGKLERLEEAHRRGVRHIQLVHYLRNDLGDFQTGEIRHNGMTVFGASVIRELNRLGMVVDVAHATETMVRQAAEVATRSLLLSHTALHGSKAMGNTPLASRQVSLHHARAVAETGGVLGVWHFFSSLERYVDGVREMADVVGVDHVAVGSDQQQAPGSLQSYAQFPRLVEAMLNRGFTREEAGKIIGGNYVRLFGQSTGAA
jgi:membrane dipeptidase